MQRRRSAWRRLVRSAAIGVDVLAKVVLVQNLMQALPWLAGIVISASVAAYGLVEMSPTVVAAAAGFGSASMLVVLTGFFRWFLHMRRDGWSAKAIRRGKQADKSERLLGQVKTELRLVTTKAERQAVALDLIHGLSVYPLIVRKPRQIDMETTRWIASQLQPAMTKLVPGISFGVVRWQGGEYSLACDLGVPEVVRIVLPKRTSSHLSKCLAALRLDKSVQIPLSEEVNLNGSEWLVAFPGEPLDAPAKAVLAVGARLIADGRRGIGD